MIRARIVRALTIAPSPTAPQPEISTVTRSDLHALPGGKGRTGAQTAMAACAVEMSSGVFQSR